MTGLRALSALWKTTEISDQRTRRSSASSARSRSMVAPELSPSTGRGWKSTSPPVITPGDRSSRMAAMESVDLPLPLSPARPTT